MHMRIEMSDDWNEDKFRDAIVSAEPGERVYVRVGAIGIGVDFNCLPAKARALASALLDAAEAAESPPAVAPAPPPPVDSGAHPLTDEHKATCAVCRL